MKIIFNRTTNDKLISKSGKNTVEIFTVDPNDFTHEMVGWQFQESKFNKEKNELTIYIWDMAEPVDYLEQLTD